MLEGEESTNIEDRRGMSGKGMAIGGGGLGMLILSLIIYLFGGSNALNLFNQATGGSDQTQVSQSQSQNPATTTHDPEEKFISSVLKSTEDVWTAQLRKMGKQYSDPILVLYDNHTTSACGQAQSAVGPFYCPGDQKLYLDFSFFDELKRKFNAPGQFAQAYVVAHEVGHHVQNLLGTMDKVNALQQRVSEAQSNQLSVMLELQADCYAGVWAHDAQQAGRLQVGDIQEALRAASAVGDDNIQKETQGYVVPDSFTHGSSQQRVSWFTRGFQSGDIRQCNTFGSR